MKVPPPAPHRVRIDSRNEWNWTKFKWTVDEIIITRWSHSNRKWVRYYVEWSSLVLSNTSCLHSDQLPIPQTPESKTIRFRIQWATITDLILQSLTHSRTQWSLIMDNSIAEVSENELPHRLTLSLFFYFLFDDHLHSSILHSNQISYFSTNVDMKMNKINSRIIRNVELKQLILVSLANWLQGRRCRWWQVNKKKKM